MTLAKTTLKGVELVRAGTWGGMTGQATITEADLADTVRAYHDPEIDRAALKIGHDGDLNLGTGQPAAGWIENLRLSADKKTLIGDLTSIPTKLASIIPTAYRRRSVEMSKGVTTPSGKRYLAALTGLALLGAKAPAVKGLADVLEIYASETETPAPGDALAAERVSLSVEDPDTTPVPHGPGKRAEAEEGTPSGVATPDERIAKVALTDALKKKLGLPETATDAEIEAALEAAEIAAPADPPAEPAAPAAPTAGTEAPAAATPAAGAEAPAAGVSLGEGETVTVSKVVFGEMLEDLKTLKADRAAERHRSALDEAVKTGRISPAERPKFAVMLAAAEAPTMTLLSELAPRYNVGIEFGDARVPAANADAELAAMHAAADAAGF